ncbi:MAG TPA: YlxR family protein [Pseudogracilibacillus sp.]|nr:YlxR family protein [Pseudogracilibacillus sp.]
MAKQRKIPQRKCVVTNEMKPKKEMIRIVRNKEKEVFIDPSGKKNGRGAYLTIDEAVISKAQQEKTLDKVFNVNVDDHIYEELHQLAKDEVK